MEIVISNISELRRGIDADISKIILDNLHPFDKLKQKDAYSRLENFIRPFKDDLTIIVETDYVDATYRDLYYHFYATKLRDYGRNCVRITFCTNAIDDTITHSDIGKLRANYLGFLILRPLGWSCIGRNVLSPEILKPTPDHLLLCKANVNSTVMGSKVSVCGFPHSSQDGEMMTCAETTIWSIMSYLANRYINYSLPLGHNILASLTDSSYERQTPSRGLNFQQISLSLQHQGLSCCVYDNTNTHFKEILSCYIESGIPLAICLEDPASTSGHAVACIGRKSISRERVTWDDSKMIITKNGHSYYEWNKCIDEFVVNDDNATAYQVMTYNNPCSYYNEPEWDNMEITHFIAPLHQRVYLDAEFAREAVIELIGSFDYNDKSIIRTFLTSSRSYRDYIMQSNDFSEDEKNLFMEVELPKFVWVTEISDIVSFGKSRVNHLLLIDATSDKYETYNSIIMKTKDGNVEVYDKKSHEFLLVPIKLTQDFQSFSNLQ